MWVSLLNFKNNVLAVGDVFFSASLIPTGAPRITHVTTATSRLFLQGEIASYIEHGISRALAPNEFYKISSRSKITVVNRSHGLFD
jgi:hypothetical protein